MTATNAGEIALKVWAVILLVSALLAIPSAVMQFSAAGVSTAETANFHVVSIWNVAHIAITIAVALLLLKFAARIAFAFGVEEASGAASHDRLSLAAVAFGILGVYFLVLGIRECAGAAFEAATKPAYDEPSIAYLWRTQPKAVIDGGVQIIAGLVLLLGRNGLSAVWSRIRARDQSAAKTDDANPPQPNSP